MLVPIKLPPGIYRSGTELNSKGRYYDCNLVRFYEGSIRPFGGWRNKSLTTVTGVGRAMHAWKDNGGVAYAAIGTESNLYVMDRTGLIKDITPNAMATGYPIATNGGGYGSGLYGSGTYGTPRADSTLTLDATMWTLDNRGQELVGCNWTDGRIFRWVPGNAQADHIDNSPSSTRAVCMTPERFVFALGAGGDPRLVAWCDQEDDTDWTPSETNQAGSFPLQTGGRIMLGKGAHGYTLVLTDIDAWAANYIGFPLVYSFDHVGSGCGAISQGSAVTLDSQVVWMSQNGFFSCNGGFVQPLPCEVQDFVFKNINRQQQTLVTCQHNSDFGEVIWRYPSISSLEIDSYVLWNYRENHWNIGSLERLSGVDRGIFQFPLAIDASGQVYEHEVGFSYDDVVPFLESGPFDIDDGDRIATALRLIPDNETEGSVAAEFRTRFYPQGPESSHGPYSLAEQTAIRFTGRQMSVIWKMSGSNDFRIGTPRLNMKTRGKR